jgi:hypothetical protein
LQITNCLAPIIWIFKLLFLVYRKSQESLTLRKRCYSNPLCRCDTFYFHNLSLFSVQPSMLFILTEVVSKNVRERWEGVLEVTITMFQQISVCSLFQESCHNWWKKENMHLFPWHNIISIYESNTRTNKCSNAIWSILRSDHRFTKVRKSLKGYNQFTINDHFAENCDLRIATFPEGNAFNRVL